MPFYNQGVALGNAIDKFDRLSSKVAKVTKELERLRRSPVSRTDEYFKEVSKKAALANDKLDQHAKKLNRLAGNQLAYSLRSVATSAIIAGSAVTALLTKTAALYDPAGAMVFQFRLRDLGAVVGKTLSPSFERLSQSVKSFSDWMYNLSPQTQSFINWAITAFVKIGALGLAFGGLVRVGGSFLGILRGLNMASMAGGAMSALTGVGGRGGRFSRMSIAGKVGASAAPAAAAGAGVGLLTESLTLGMGTTGAMLGAQIGGGWGAAIGGLGGLIAGGLIHKLGGGDAPRKDSAGLAPEPAQTLSSGLQGARMLREAALNASGLDAKSVAVEENTAAIKELTKVMGNEKDPDGIHQALGVETPEAFIHWKADTIGERIRARDRAAGRPVQGG